MIVFPIQSLMDEQACYHYLLEVLHPQGLCCPQGHLLPADQAPHDTHRAPVMDYRCKTCGAVFNLFANTIWSKSRYSCANIVLILRGFAQGTPTAHLAQELGLDRTHLLALRHEIQQLIEGRFPNAGEKGRKHEEPDDPPRRRANKVKGHGTWDRDRPPIVGVVGRESGLIGLQVCHHSDRETLQPFVEDHTGDDVTVYTDEWQAYDHLDETGRTHASVCHLPGQREWARDGDGDGVREVHCNTMEGIWTGLRNFLRFFRGLNKEYLSQYIAIFQVAHNFKRITPTLLRAMMSPFTFEAT